MPEIREEIKTALERFGNHGQNFDDAVIGLLKTLGYESERAKYFSGTPEEFNRQYPPESYKTDTKSGRQFLKITEKTHTVIQITNEEISKSPSLFSSQEKDFQSTDIKSFLFIAIELKKGNYPRGVYADLTREINKHFAMPTVVVFHNPEGKQLTIAFINRRVSKTDTGRDVLEKVHLIKDINTKKPHRAHLDILAQLSLPECLKWIAQEKQTQDFDGLLKAWLATLDIEELNKKFYKELLKWFEWAKETAKFPTGDSKQPIKWEDQIIRLITRLLFVWFIKEKGLVAEDLFHRAQIENLLKDKCKPDGGDYYRAVLQNLFFATLNTEIYKREFSRKTNADHRNFNLYRYENLLKDKSKLFKLMRQTPFINGGLFDCLDSFEATGNDGYRIDCFTDNTKHGRELSVPNKLFFDTPKGFFTILQQYKFTVEENTPIEQEVALDPELLGKVFENLLAEYNPETQKTARKQSGSYYTPREIVDYMVNEALIARLADMAEPSIEDPEFWRERLSYLLDYADSFNDAEQLFDETEKKRIVKAISQIKVLDPAVGSGAFPMGILHKLTLALKRIDPENKHWQKLQKELATGKVKTAFGTKNQRARDKELKDISHTFETYRDSDFGRKLYLIQNSIYGVDIQPVACQISKLRFFISLAIEQEPNKKQKDNFGIKPLPNLETRFVTANTLIVFSKKDKQMSLTDETVQELERKLHENREKHFNAKTRKSKLRCIEEDKKLRNQLVKQLKKTFGFDNQEADRIAQWNPYNQNGVADWFDAEYMFGVKNGFDIVIGNPPYIQLQKDGGRLGSLYQNCNFKTFARSGDIYQLFYERGMQLLTDAQGILAFITSNSWMRAQYGKKLRGFLRAEHSPLRLIDMGKNAFEAIVDTNILLASTGRAEQEFKAVDMDSLAEKQFPPAEHYWSEIEPADDVAWSILSPLEKKIKSRIEQLGTPLKDWDIRIYRGVLTGLNDAFIIDTAKRDELLAADPKSAEIIKPILRGRDVGRYGYKWAGKWVIATFPALKIDIDHYLAIKNHLLSFGKDRLEQAGKALSDGTKSRKKTGNKWFETQDQIGYHTEFEKEKLIWMHMSGDSRFSYSNGELYCNNKCFIVTGGQLKYLGALLNSKLVSWLMKVVGVPTGMGLIQWDKFTVETIPCVRLSQPEQQPFMDIVDQILTAKQQGKDTTALEAEIDKRVYQLYNLISGEIKIIEAKK